MKPMLWILPLTLSITGCRNAETNRGPRHDAAPAAMSSPQSAPATSGGSTGSAASAAPGTVAITPATAQIEFTGSTALQSHTGNFAAFNGTVELPTDDPGRAKIQVVVDMNSTTTKIGLLTKHLKAADFFDVAHYPRAEFVSDSITATAETGIYRVAGRLTLHGVSRPVTFPARIDINPDTLAFDGTMVVSQTGFGMIEAAKKTKDAVPVRVAIRTKRR